MINPFKTPDGENRISPGRLTVAICFISFSALALWAWRVSAERTASARQETLRIYRAVTNAAIKQAKQPEFLRISPLEELRIDQRRSGYFSYSGWIEFAHNTNTIRKWFTVEIREASLTNETPEVQSQIFENEPRR